MSQGWCLTVMRTNSNGGGLHRVWPSPSVEPGPSRWGHVGLYALTCSISERTGIGVGWRRTPGLLVCLSKADELGLMPDYWADALQQGAVSAVSGAGTWSLSGRSRLYVGYGVRTGPRTPNGKGEERQHRSTSRWLMGQKTQAGGR